MALDAVARFRDRGEPVVLVARGWNGSEAATTHRRALRAHAAHLDLPWSIAGGTARDGTELAAALAAVAPAASGVVEVASPVASAPLRALYAASDAVLANTGFEPFGLVGLEAMATRSIVVTGSTGEDYLVPFQNGFALDTDDAAEIVGCFDWMRRSRGREASLRAAAHVTARRYRWADVIERLVLALGL
jgi:glycosyltransferase involved in cell wall biosynthesis